VDSKEASKEAGKVEEEKVSPLSSPVTETIGVPTTVVHMNRSQDGHSVPALESFLQDLAPFQRLRLCFPWWERHAPPRIQRLILEGVEPRFQGDHLQFKEQKKSQGEIDMALGVMAEYVETKAAKEVPLWGTRYLVPWFVIQKTEPQGGEKFRLISDCREINQGLVPPHFKLDHWKEIFPHLQQGMWATKIDLKNAYFHLELSPALKPFIRMKLGDKVFQMEGACFGLNTLPYWWMQVMGVFLKKWRKAGLQVFIYLDDILLIAKSKLLAEKHTAILLQDLLKSG